MWVFFLIVAIPSTTGVWYRDIWSPALHVLLWFWWKPPHIQNILLGLIMKCVKISSGRWEYVSQGPYWLVTGASLQRVIGWHSCDVECFVGIDCRSCCALLDIWTTWPPFLSYTRVTFMHSQNACSMTSLDSPRMILAVSDILREQNCARWNSRMLSLQGGLV